MLQAIVNWSIHNRAAVVILAVLLLLAGLYATQEARLDVFPEFAPPQVIIQTEAPGLAPQQVEQLITQPIENEIQGIPRLDTLRSQSIQGLSVVTAIFKDGTDIYRARQQVSERLAGLSKQLPQDLIKGSPRMAPLTSTTGRLLTVGFTSDRLSALELRDRVQWTIRPQILAVPGVAQVTIYGGEVRQFQVQLVPEELAGRNLTVSDVLDATRQASGISRAGYQENRNQRVGIVIEAQARSVIELAATVLTTADGTPVRLGDVARVVEAPEPKFGDAALNDEDIERRRDVGKALPLVLGRGAAYLGAPLAPGPLLAGLAVLADRVAIRNEPGVLLVVYKQIDEDTRAATLRVERRLEELRPYFTSQEIAYHPGLFRQANFIEEAVHNVTQSLLLGAVLVSVVLFVFLFDFQTALVEARGALTHWPWWALPWRLGGIIVQNLRVAFISLTAIPLSLLGAIVVLWAWGVGLNTMTLGGLAIAVGEVVDDAIIDVENIYRRLRENAQLPQPRAALAVVLSASMEVRGAVVYATFIVVLVFVPVFMMSGLQGRLFAPLGYAYVLAVLASLGVALTVTPALALLLLAPRREGSVDATVALPHTPTLLRWLQAGYDWVLRALDRQLPLVITVMLGLAAAAVFAASTSESQLMPELRENHLVVHQRGLPGTSLELSLRGGNEATRLMRTEPELRDVVRSSAIQVGRAELGEDTAGVEYSEMEVDLRSTGAEDVRAVQQRLARALGQKCPGFSFEVMPFLTERIRETLSGTNKQVVVNLYGDNLEALDAAAQKVSQVLGKIKGRDGNPAAASLLIEPQTGVPELRVRPRWEDASRLGLRNAHLVEVVNTAFQGAELGQIYDRNRVIDLTVVLGPEARNRPETVADLWLSIPAARGPAAPADAAGEGRVQLRQVADVYLSDGRFLIAHERGLRRQQVACNVQNLDLDAFVSRAERDLRKEVLPGGITYEFTGEQQARRTAQREVLLWSGVALAGIVLLLWMVFRSLRHLLLVSINVVFALIGGVAALYMSGGTISVGSLVGGVTLIGITMRNGIMMVSHWQHLHDVEGMARGPELVFRGARERLAPVLMTALVTGLGLLPIALGSGEAGREIEGPMALVILGGLVTSTALNLLVLPALYRRFAGA